MARSGVLLRFAYLLCGDRHLAEDLVQEVLIKAHRRWSAIEADSPDAYLKRAMVRTHVSWRRRRSSTELTTAAVRDEVGGGGFDDTHASRDELWALLARLPRAQRAVLVLRYYEDLDDQRIAELVGLSQSSVRVYAHRGLQALREMLVQKAQEAPSAPGLLDKVRAGAGRAQQRRRAAIAGGALAGVVVMLLLLVPWLRSGIGPDVPPVVPSPSLTPSPSITPSPTAPRPPTDLVTLPVPAVPDYPYVRLPSRGYWSAICPHRRRASVAMPAGYEIGRSVPDSVRAGIAPVRYPEDMLEGISVTVLTEDVVESQNPQLTFNLTELTIDGAPARMGTDQFGGQWLIVNRADGRVVVIAAEPDTDGPLPTDQLVEMYRGVTFRP